MVVLYVLLCTLFLELQLAAAIPAGDLLNNLSIYSKISSNGRLGHVSKSADVDGDVEWSIPNFFSLPQKNGESYWSPNFSLGGQEWFMRIFPNGGWSGNENSEHIDLIVVRNFSGRPSMQNISLSLKTVTGEKDNEHSAKLFQGWTERGFGHIFLQFISRSELTTRQSELMPHGALTVVCTMSQAAPARNTSDLLNNLSIYSKISSNGRLGHVSKSADVDGDVEWSIPNFFSLPQKNGESYWSPNFSLGGQEWFMRIFPNGGWSGNQNSEHIDLIVVRNFSGRPSMQNISLSLKTVTGEKDNEHSAKLFQGWTERGFGHIFLQFISRSELTTRQSELMPHGALTVVCTMSQAAPARNTSDLLNNLSIYSKISSNGRLGHVSKSADVDGDVEWSIPNFFSLPQKNGESYWSPNFSLGGQEWFMRIFPNGGWSGNENSEHIDLIVVRNFSGRPSMQNISLSLKTVTGEKDNEHSAKLFQGWTERGFGHIFLQFISRSELTTRQSELMPHGALTVVCTMSQAAPARNTSNTTSAECRHCKGTFNADSLYSHQKKCMHRPTKCPDCLEVVVLEKWLNEHECQQERPEDDGSLCQDFKKLLLEGLNHDLILKVGDKELRAHRDVLRARSKVFKSMLDYDMKEKKSGIIDIPDCDPLAMEQFLFYIYSGNVETLDQSNMLKLYYIADKYEMKGLKKECSDFIRESLSQANICDVIQLALNHSDSSLLESTTAYFRKNMLDIMRTVEWQVFLKENSTVANELLIKAVENLSNVKS